MKIKNSLRQIIFTLIVFMDFHSLTANTLPPPVENQELEEMSFPDFAKAE